MESNSVRQIEYHFSVLGRTLAHLGVQLYKQRPSALIELIANSWDADSKNVHILIPTSDEYDKDESEIIVRDDGCGMNNEEIQNNYLVVGRNRREEAQKAGLNEVEKMGKKGIGKLAGFGIGRIMTIESWKNQELYSFTLDSENLVNKDNSVKEISIPGSIRRIDNRQGTDSGTIVTIKGLKHDSPIDIDALHTTLARRFSSKVRGKMSIYINGEKLREINAKYTYKFPEDKEWKEETLSDGNTFRYRWFCSDTVLKHTDMRGFSIISNGRSVQSAPFFFFVEQTASGQHGTRYLFGEIEADFLDSSTSSEEDPVSTDRQELDWESSNLVVFKEWGKEMARVAIRDCADRVGDETKKWLLNLPDFKYRIEKIDKFSAKQLNSILTGLGKSIGPSNDESREKVVRLADSVIKAFEFRQFYDITESFTKEDLDPDDLVKILEKLQEWKILESRALLEIISGRLKVVNIFIKSIQNDLRETAAEVGQNNLHDLLATYPWLIDPEWQALEGEITITKVIREYADADYPIEDRHRVDFFGLKGDGKHVVVEIKRGNWPLTFDELQKIESYYNKLAPIFTNLEIHVLYSGTLSVTAAEEQKWKNISYLKLIDWKFVINRVKKHYEHYSSILDSNISNSHFKRLEDEAAATRGVIENEGIYRGKEGRAAGLGPKSIE